MLPAFGVNLFAIDRNLLSQVIWFINMSSVGEMTENYTCGKDVDGNPEKKRFWPPSEGTVLKPPEGKIQ